MGGGGASLRGSEPVLGALLPYLLPGLPLPLLLQFLDLRQREGVLVLVGRVDRLLAPLGRGREL